MYLCTSPVWIVLLVFKTSRGSSGKFLVIVALFVMTKNPAMKTTMKVTPSMKTTMTTGQLRVLRIIWSYSVLSTTICLLSGSSVFTLSLPPYDLVLVSVVSPSCRRSDVNPFFTCYSVKFFHVGLRVCPWSCVRSWCCSSSK